MLNPYASFLGDRNPIEVIAKTPGELARYAEQLGPERSEKPAAPGKWSAHEIAAHLADTEIAFAFRLRQALAEDNHLVQPFDQDQWAKNYRAYGLKEALETFRALRAWNVALVRSLKPTDFDKTLRHPERGEMTFRTLVETMGGHDLNHLEQVKRIAAQFAAA